ncbi:hypothetical protein LZ757_03355 [Xylella fastidiosa subsp. morus]|uniref:hypothetical protein n=1 Tax=Xylella fastidiosa TaxID=2371 RepID=UPI001F468E3A|nr:hypothetical protein [Xylella fastidiosa]UIT37286.1 hypothetical protein LZ757_03355 [Xylella fastidiosa subsp. morus]
MDSGITAVAASAIGSSFGGGVVQIIASWRSHAWRGRAADVYFILAELTIRTASSVEIKAVWRCQRMFLIAFGSHVVNSVAVAMLWRKKAPLTCRSLPAPVISSLIIIRIRQRLPRRRPSSSVELYHRSNGRRYKLSNFMSRPLYLVIGDIYRFALPLFAPLLKRDWWSS